LRLGDGFPFALIANLRAFGTADVGPHPSGGDNDESRAVFRCWLRRRRVDFDPPYRDAPSARWRAEAEERATEARASIVIEKARAANSLRAFTGEKRNSSRSRRARDGHRFESPQLHHEVRANRRDFLRRQNSTC
jgi:hypothetical protein